MQLVSVLSTLHVHGLVDLLKYTTNKLQVHYFLLMIAINIAAE